MSGAHVDRRQSEPFQWRSNDSLAPWGYKRIPWALLPTHQAFLEHTTTLRLCDHAFEVFERDLSAFSVSLLCHFVVALSSLQLCLWCCDCALVCVLTPSLTLSLIVIIYVKPWETPNLWRFLTNGFDIRNTYVALKFDLWITWEGLSATLDQRRSPQQGVGIGWTTIKNVVSLVSLLDCDYCLLEFSYSLRILLLEFSYSLRILLLV
jgi:hypothetical protein